MKKRSEYKKPQFSLHDQHGFVLFVGNLKQIRRRFRNVFLSFPIQLMEDRAKQFDLYLRPVIEKLPLTAYTSSMDELKTKLTHISNSPGAYLFKDKDGRVIYVGKAKNLRSRVGQYFGHDTRVQIPFLISEAVDIDTISTATELEALFLENTLIKQYMPKYNIKLRDDKNYAFIKIDYTTQIPTIGYVRKVEKNSKAKYFGPYTSAFKIKKTLDFVRKIFPYCANKEFSKRPCFYYYLHRCPGVCIGKISLEEYGEYLERIQLFLSGKSHLAKQALFKSMKEASREEKFELAGRLRDQYQALEILDERQSVQFPARVDWDFVSLYSEGLSKCVNLFKIRDGKLLDKENFIYTQLNGNNGEVIEYFLENYYEESSDLPRDIYIQESINSEPLELIHELLRERAKRKIVVSVPTRGKKLQLINLGITNAQQFLHKWEANSAENLDKLHKALEKLQELLKLPNFPHRIEGYDISNVQGTNPVGSMVVSKDGLAAKSEYKKFKINVKSTPDDFAMMREMLSRRVQHIEGIGNKDIPVWPTPDLFMIDGGKGQLAVAVEVFEKYGVKIPVIGLAKRIEEIFLPHNSEPIILGHDDPTLHILQRLRDEAHRFAITFHRSLRSKQAVKSELDSIPGIGPKTKKLLKKKFGTVSVIREQTLESLAEIVGEDKAKKIKAHLP